MQMGADVVVLQRAKPAAQLVELAANLGRNFKYYPTDLSQSPQVQEAASAVLTGGQVHILVNNAGAQRRAPAANFPIEDFEYVLRVNLRAAFQLCQLFGVPMLERRSGKIVNVASLLSFQGGLTVPAYAASKGGLAQLTKALCNEWARSGVNVNAVAPGYMDTDLNTALRADPVRSRQISERIPAARWGTPKDIGHAVGFLCSSAADYIHGQVLVVDGGWLAR
jgi:2-deoxy-D-gluconate 3-dehydrogenase